MWLGAPTPIKRARWSLTPNNRVVSDGAPTLSLLLHQQKPLACVSPHDSGGFNSWSSLIGAGSTLFCPVFVLFWNLNYHREALLLENLEEEADCVFCKIICGPCSKEWRRLRSWQSSPIRLSKLPHC